MPARVAEGTHRWLWCREALHLQRWLHEGATAGVATKAPQSKKAQANEGRHGSTGSAPTCQHARQCRGEGKESPKQTWTVRAAVCLGAGIPLVLCKSQRTLPVIFHAIF